MIIEKNETKDQIVPTAFLLDWFTTFYKFILNLIYNKSKKNHIYLQSAICVLMILKSVLINEKIEELTGEGTEVKSFVSDKNTKVDSVLFVIKTPAIQVQEAEQVVEEEPEETGLWQKFINLFK